MSLSPSPYLFSLNAILRQVSMMWATSIWQGQRVVHVSHVAHSQMALS